MRSITLLFISKTGYLFFFLLKFYIEIFFTYKNRCEGRRVHRIHNMKETNAGERRTKVRMMMRLCGHATKTPPLVFFVTM